MVCHFLLLLSLVECTVLSVWSFTSSSLSSQCLPRSSSGCTNTWTPPSTASRGGLDVNWCELEHVDSCWCWSSLWQNQSSLWCVETTPNSGMLVTTGDWFLGNWGRQKEEIILIYWTHYLTNTSAQLFVISVINLTDFGVVICWMRNTRSWTGLLRLTQRDSSLMVLLWVETCPRKEYGIESSKTHFIKIKEKHIC